VQVSGSSFKASLMEMSCRMSCVALQNSIFFDFEMEEDMQVKDAMTTELKVAHPSMTISQAAKMMKEGDFGYLPVGDKDHLLGAVTDRDMVVRGLAAGAHSRTSVSKVMSRLIVYCFDDDDIREAADLMKREQIRRLAVLNDQKRLVGILTLGDIARVGLDKAITGDIETRVSQYSVQRLN